MIWLPRPAHAGLVLLLLALSPLTSLEAQGARDSLIAGRRAYERAELQTAIRLLEVGLAAGGSARDTLWVGGAHMLTDALLEQGKDTLAALWAKWALRAAPGLPIDSSTYPPRVARALLQARAALGAGAGTDAAAAMSTLEPAGDPASGRGVLRLQRGAVSAEAAVENVGTILSGEFLTLPAGTYTVRITAQGYPTAAVTREVLPGFATLITPRLARPAAAAGAAAPAGPGAAGGAAASAAAIRGATLAAAGATSCAILEGGKTTCWGENRAGQLGSGATDSSHGPALVAGGRVFAAISVAATHACALAADSHAWCWGQGSNGELGNGQTTTSPTPVPVSSAVTFVAIGVGLGHSCALTASGAVYCWGSNRNGELGSRGASQSATPVAVTAPQGVVFTALAVGGAHACALAASGSAYCWGSNSSGQLGTGSTGDASAPVAVQAPVPLRSLALGASHTCGLTAGGTAHCWGSNSSGQLGLGAEGPPQSLRPAPVADALTFTSLATGDAHTCGLTADGAAYCWGAGRSGQLGNAQGADRPRPTLVVGGQVFRALSLGAGHSCGVATDGIAWCWGDNAAGQLGALAGRTNPVPVPVLVRPGTHGVAIGLLPARSVRETFDDGDWTAAPAWFADSAPGVAMTVAEQFLEMTRGRGRFAGPGAGLALPVRIPVTRATQVQFDVMVLADSLRPGCGLNCASWPAVVRVRVKNNDLTESEVWYAYSDRGGQSRSLGSVAIVAKADAEAGHWMRAQRFTIRDALPRADTILQIAIGSVGTEVGARFDNIFVPVPVPASLVVAPDNAQIATVGATQQLRAAVHDSAGGPMPWVRVTWSSTDTAVARVDGAGLVTAVAGGRAVIRVAAGALKDSAAVTVTAPRPPARPRRPRRP